MNTVSSPTKSLPGITALVMAVTSLCCSNPASAYNNDRNQYQQYRPPAYQQAQNYPQGQTYQQSPRYQQSISFHDYISTHPKLKSATVGAGVGTAAGAITGMLTGRGAMRGALIGASAGAGTGLIRSSQTMQRHPIVNTIATGTMLGLGLGMAGGRMPGTSARTAGVGAAAGLGTALLMHGL